MKKGYKVVMLLSLSLMLLLTACSRKAGGTGMTTKKARPIIKLRHRRPRKEVVLTIPHHKTGQNVGGKFFLPQGGAL